MLARTTIAAVIATCSLVSLAVAESLEVKQQRAKEEASAKEHVDEVNKFCGSSFKFKFDWSTWKQANDEEGHHAYSNCGQGLDGIRDVCTEEMGKEAVAKQLKSVVCIGNSKENEATYKSGTLTIRTSLDMKDVKVGLGQAVKAALGKGLE